MQSDQRALLCSEYASDRKALDIKVLHISKLSSLADYLVLATGTSDRQVQAIAESVRLGLKQNYNLQPLAVEGMNEGRWVLLDYGDVMVHVFQQEVRSFYDLDGLWSEADELELLQENAANR
ncbi:ribosome silencing factor [uncultured Desulfuromonas sp.]|uniref:ribosome silencing factor n=1 Tax=uncultured Desulfuromonas sp. TaxID=181013 RepID=UPI002AAB2EF9|nr:ribosome silencing factor [uncultured Desulfuromonas sp.]